MRIQQFSVERYRSITSAQKLPLSRVTTLVGPNNEGKSNILRALVVGMRLLAQLGKIPPQSRRRMRRADEFEENYRWRRDFPKSLQESMSSGRTIFDFEFELNDVELEEFREAIGSTLNGQLPVRLMIDREGQVEVKIRKQGPGQKKLMGKREEIANFVGSRLRFQYVPSFRTAEESRRVVDDMVSAALTGVEQSQEFRSAVEAIDRAQAPVLQALSQTVRDSLKEFLPDIKSVNIQISNDARYSALRAHSRFVVDDGTATDLALKGDGVQSLAAIALLRRAAADAQQRNVDLVLAIEEPEAHLHPNAVHQLKSLLEEIGQQQQVIITTHSPLLANRINVRSNIVVTENEAVPAACIADVRDVLGVRLSDNLQSARVVLVVEGEDDAMVMRHLLGLRSKKLSGALRSADLAIESLGGATNLPYKLAHLRSAACVWHVFADNDDAGRSSVQAAQDQGLLRPAEVTMTVVPRMADAEMEDLIDLDVYKEALEAEWNLDLSASRFRHTRAKWSDRLKDVFAHAGQAWSKRVKGQAKAIVADQVVAGSSDPLIEQRSGPIATLVTALERRLDGDYVGDRPTTRRS